MFLRYSKLAPTPCLSEGFGLGHTVSNWAMGKGSLSRKLFSGTVCGHTCSEVSSLRAKQAVTPTAAVQTSSTPSSSQLTSQFR